MDVQATRKTAELAQQMRRLHGFVYVSTAYVNSNLPRGSHIEERIYPLYYSNGNRILHGHLAAQLAALPASRAERLVGCCSSSTAITLPALCSSEVPMALLQITLTRPTCCLFAPWEVDAHDTRLN